jgi:hypothetical protein
MRQLIEIEDIDYLRRSNGIEDVKLQQEIERLKAGSVVKLTFLAGPRCSETLAVRITSIRGSGFRGKLVKSSTVSGLSELRPESIIVFTADHIHSIVKAKPVP